MKIAHMLSAALVASMVGMPSVLSAQQSAPTTAVPPAPSPTQSEGAAGYLKLDDMNVVTPGGEKVGEVDEVLIDATGEVIAVAIEVGGFLGIGDDEVIIPLDQLRLENNQLVTTLTKEQIEALPKWDD
jgi:ribosomal 30S subunit maturation factor RimM